MAVAALLLLTAPCAHALAVGLTSSAASSRTHVPLMSEVVNVGIIGAGRIGIVHLEALASCENANPVIISNPTISKAQAAAEKYKLPAFTGDAMEVINNPD